MIGGASLPASERRMRTLRFGFIGLGFATTWLHLPAARAVPGAELVGGVDLDPARQSAWTALGAGPVYDSPGAMLEAARPEVVVVATPPDSHARLCIAALESGAHVICEKPFVETVAQADEVIAVARRMQRSVAINHEFRYMPIFSILDQVVGGPGVGRPVFLHCTQLMDLAPWEEKVPWRAQMPDRALFEGGVHLVDLFHRVAGRLPKSVSAMTSSGLDPSRTADAIDLVSLDYGSGLLGQLTIDRLCRSGTRYADLRIDCEHASVRSSFGGRAMVRVGVKRAERKGIRVEFGMEGLAWVEKGLDRRTIARNPRHATVKATADLYQANVAALRAGTEPPTTALIARDTLRIIEAAYRSARTGQRVDVSSGDETSTGAIMTDPLT